MDKLKNTWFEISDFIELNILNWTIGIIFIVLGFTVVNFVLRKYLTLYLSKKASNPILTQFTIKLLSIALKLVVVFISLDFFGLKQMSSNLLAGAGILTFVIGFAFKDIGENFLAGIILAFKSPFKINDIIETTNVIGYVIDVNLRETNVKTLDGKDVFVPNSVILKNPLYNYTVDGLLRYEFVIGIDYEDDVTKAIEVILKSLENIKEIQQDKYKPNVIIEDLGINTVNLKVLFWIDTFKHQTKTLHQNTRSRIISSVLTGMKENNIYLPANIVEIKRYKK